MKIGIVGLGKMGMAITRRLLAHGHDVVAFDISSDNVAQAGKVGAAPADSLEELVEKLDESPRAVWVMVPAGDPVALTVQDLAQLLDEEDIIIEGGNSNYKESMERAQMLSYKGIFMLDIGVSGGVWGEERGFNLMAGGEQEAFDSVEPILKTLAPENGYALVGTSGAGHFVKMVHNGIEYGIMQAIAEGFELIEAKDEFNVDLHQLARLWERGSVIRSWLLELTGNVFEEDQELEWVEPFVPDSGEGRWTVEESIDLAVPIPVIALALQMRFRSRQDNSYSARVLAALRNQFGGHKIHRKDE